MNRSYANAETEITISTQPAEGYELASISVTDDQGNEIPLNNEVLNRAAAKGGEAGTDEGADEEVEDNIDLKTFIMPHNSVSIVVTFKASTTGIQTIKGNTQRQDGKWYTLSGVAVDKPTKGLYIHNGKKVVIK